MHDVNGRFEQFHNSPKCLAVIHQYFVINSNYAFLARVFAFAIEQWKPQIDRTKFYRTAADIRFVNLPQVLGEGTDLGCRCFKHDLTFPLPRMSSIYMKSVSCTVRKPIAKLYGLEGMTQLGKEVELGEQNNDPIRKLDIGFLLAPHSD